MLGQPDAAADAVAEGLVRAYRHLASCRDPARLRTWLYRIVANRCKSYLARRSSMEVRLDYAPPIGGPPDSGAIGERNAQIGRVQRDFATVTPAKRVAFVIDQVATLR